MIRKNNEYHTEIRSNMRGGNGEVKIEHFWKPGSEMLAKNRMFARLTLNEGCSIGLHEHANEEEVFVIVQGTGELNDNGNIAIVSAGDSIITGNGASHSVKCISREPLEIIAVISSY